MEKSEEVYKEALYIYKSLAKSNPKAYNSEVATTLNNLASLYYANNQMEKSEEVYKEALYIYKSLAKNNPESFIVYAAKTL